MTPGAVRTVWLLVRIDLLHWLNRGFSGSRRKKKGRGEVAAARVATPRKGKGGRVLLAIFGPLFFFYAIFMSGVFLERIVETHSLASDPIPVRRSVYQHLWDTHRSLEDLEQDPPSSQAPFEARREEFLETLEERLACPCLHPERLSQEAVRERAAAYTRIFRERGIEAFRPLGRGESIILAAALQAGSGATRGAARVVGLMLILLAAYQVLIRLDSHDQIWNLEWLFTLPVPARTIFLTRILGGAFANPVSWFIALPIMIVLFWSTGWGLGALPLALAATAIFQMSVGAIQMAGGIWLRGAVDPARLQNIRGACTLVGLLLIIVVYLAFLSPGPSGTFSQAAEAISALLFWNPFSLPALLALGGASVFLCAGALVLTGITLPWAALALASHAVRGGLPQTGRLLLQGSRSGPRRGPTFWPAGIAGKDLRLMLRDRSFLIQTTIVPLFILGIQAMINPGIFTSATSDFRHAALLAFGVCAYIFAFSAFRILSLEGAALWILYTLPRGLDRILVQKTCVWCVLASIYAGLILSVSAALGSPAGTDAVLLSILVLAGVWIHAFIAAGIGCLATDPLERETERKTHPVLRILYLYVAGLFAFAIYQPSAWAKIAQVILAAVLAFALWQKVRDQAPYLLDPTAAPPPRIALSDGIIAALTFFVLQGLFGLALVAGEVAPDKALFLAFLGAGALTAPACMFVFWLRKVPGLRSAVGLVWPAGGEGGILALSTLLGLGSGLIGVAYKLALERLDFLGETLEHSTLLGFDAGVTWIVLLAVGAAPLFEEFIFRGLVYRGIRRSAGPAVAILLSAALFAIVHPPVSIAPVFVMGLAAALAFERSGTLFAPILVHALYNALMVATG